MNPGDRPVVLAAVAGAHGVRGEVRLKLFTSSADNLAQYRQFDAGERKLTLKSVRATSAGAVARFAGIEDRTTAESLRGALLTVPRSSLPPLGDGERYWHDLIGLEVETTTGDPVGRVTSVENYGASDLLEIRLPSGKHVLVPFIAEAVTETGGKLQIGREWLG